MKKDLIKIATITDAHGIKGEVKLRCFSEDPDFLSSASELLDYKGKKLSIKATGKAKNAIIASIAGINDRNAAELLKNTDLYIPLANLPEPKEGELYHSDLIGLEARLESGKKFGTIAAIHNFGAGDIIEINTNTGTSEMLPLAEPWVAEINLEESYITVIPAEYL